MLAAVDRFGSKKVEFARARLVTCIWPTGKPRGLPLQRERGALNSRFGAPRLKERVVYRGCGLPTRNLGEVSGGSGGVYEGESWRKAVLREFEVVVAALELVGSDSVGDLFLLSREAHIRKLLWVGGEKPGCGA